MNYTVKYRSWIICDKVDKGCAKAICQLLIFLTGIKQTDICLEDIKICWTEPPTQYETDIHNFTQDRIRND